MKISFFSLNDHFAKLRLSTIMASLFLIIFGIQGILNVLNPNYFNIENLKLYSIILIIIGVILLVLSCFKKKEEVEYYSLYANPNYILN